jgi:ribosomal protein S18 acetylase RimI-like enzyme
MTAFADNEGHRFSPYYEWRGFMMARETFKPELWFLAEAGGRIVAAALCPDYGDHGWLRQFAVVRDFRGRGIGAALLRHVFREQFACGNKSVGLVVDSYNRTGARAVYERAGMHLDRQHDAYEKVIRAAS